MVAKLIRAVRVAEEALSELTKTDEAVKNTKYYGAGYFIAMQEVASFIRPLLAQLQSGEFGEGD